MKRGKNEEQEANLTTRRVNLSGILGSGHWEKKDWSKECSSIVDTGFNGGGAVQSCVDAEICILSSELLPKTNLVRYKEGVLRFIFGNRQGRNSESSTVMPIWVDGDFKPVKYV